ncbi:MAG: protein kinase [Pseudomonas sp.]|nr:protein kinase [Pseudomonas sp.]
MDTLARLKAGLLAGTTRLDLSCGLSEFPREIFDLADSLEILNLSGNALSSLPDDLHRLTRMKVLFCSDNQFTELPACIGQCPQLSMVGFKANRIVSVPAAALPAKLRWLILTDNCIEQLPEALGEHFLMQKLMLSGNRLRQLPGSMAKLHNLELLRLSANQLEYLPAWLLQLESLAWLAYAGNPMGEAFDTPQDDTQVVEIPWAELTLAQQLGEGASGVIRQGLWRGTQPVAVKLYKGHMTSDGTPLNEMNACLAAGNHPNLIKVLGRIVDHPQGATGLVMELIDPAFKNLAGLPSLDTCSRDVYAAHTQPTPEAALRIARGIASVAAHLHARGIAHGDLYAHNILWREDGECLLGDFGAACFYPRDRSRAAELMERIEVNAFGILLGELLDICGIGGNVEDLDMLHAECTQPDMLDRPWFEDIHDRLNEYSLPE